MRATLTHAIGVLEDDQSKTVDQIITLIKEHLQRQRNVALRLVKFEERKHEGERFYYFYVALKELADDTELCDQCLDVRLVTRITSGVRDQQTQKKFLAVDPPPTLSAALSLCRSEEPAFNTDADLSCGSKRTVNKLHAPKPRSRSKIQGKQCWGCGGEWHTQGRKKQCPAWDKRWTLLLRR